MVQLAHYFDFFMESVEVAKAKIAAVDERVARAERELCEVEAYALEVK